MATQKKSVAQLAKKTKTPVKKTTPPRSRKKTTPEPDSSEEKTKKKVEELLGDINLDIHPSKEEKKTKEEVSSHEWLSEQVTKLSDENERLRAELKRYGDNTLSQQKKLSRGDDMVKNNVLTLYNEFLKQKRLRGAFKVNSTYLMPKMVDLFPFLREYDTMD
jgi:hypothetical protein